MKTVRIALNGGRYYNILIGSGLSDKLPELLDFSQRLWVFDDRTRELFASRLLGAGEEGFSFGRGEEDKGIEQVISICKAALRGGVRRNGGFIAVGGGVTGDLTGFASGIYLRGVGCVQVPTTLLAMVDSSVGGKTAADLPEGKNLIGLFHQPQMVIIDPSFLTTLPVREMRNGVAEMIKMALSFDAGFFHQLELIGGALADVNKFQEHAEALIGRCCELKAAVVAADECEQSAGGRELLNFGHTFGHGVESASNFAVSHGEAVAIGMVLAGIAAGVRGIWSEKAQQQLVSLLQRVGLPTALPPEIRFADVLGLMRRDKKNRDSRIRLILPAAVGQLAVFDDFSDDELALVWQRGGGIR